MSLRSALAWVTLGFLVVTGGCLGVLTGSEPLTFDASAATVSDAALDSTGYELDDRRSETITRSFSIAGQEREVRVTNSIARYERSIELGPLGEQELGVFVVVSTPQVRILGRAFNPVGEMSTRELLGTVQSRYEGFRVGDRVDAVEVVVLGTATTVEVYEASATFQGREIPLSVYVTTVEDGDDYVLGIGIHPRSLPGEGGRMIRLYEGIRH